MALWKPYADDVPQDSQKYFAPQLAVSPNYLPPVPPADAPAKKKKFHLQPVPPTEAPPHHLIDADALSDDPDFQEYERNALRVMAAKNGGALLGNNPRMRRTVRSTNSNAADDTYRRQREKNNYAAKQSRDRRKLREIHLALKVRYLKKEVAALTAALGTRVCSQCQQSCLC